MKLPLSWLLEWVDVKWPAAEVASRLTMAGFEIESLAATADGDHILEINVTPNRGDAMSVVGIARELAALSGLPLKNPLTLLNKSSEAPGVANKDSLEVQLTAPAACPVFVGQILRGLDNRAPSPAWLSARLLACGIRSISPVVDVTNYVLLELGQPMHAYDLGAVRGGIAVRFAHAAEAITLLDGRGVTLTEDVLVIADSESAVGVAGIMGGQRTSVTANTVDVFLEAAWFQPSVIAGRARRFGLHTDASQRFERGVDPDMPERAMRRAVQLLVQIAGAKPADAQTTSVPGLKPARLPILLRLSELHRTLGIPVAAGTVDAAFKALGLVFAREGDLWTVTPPAYRFDLAISADLVEEVARIVGFAAIPEEYAAAQQKFQRLAEELPSERSLVEVLVNRGYQEAITLAFVDPALQKQMFPDTPALALANPISTELSQMRVSLWPGLVRAAAENLRRQQDRVRLFEHGVKFLPDETSGAATTTEVDVIAGICAGSRLPEQWGAPRAAFDFFDIKGDVEALIAATGAVADFAFEAAVHSALHPGRSAQLLRKGQSVGWLGELHPRLVRALGLAGAPLLFEIEVLAGLASALPRAAEVSRFPHVRRDLAIVVDDSVTFSDLRERVVLASPDALRAVRVFDVYTGTSVEKGRKSIALGLIYQDFSRTLTDAEADAAVASVANVLRQDLNARIRE